MLSRDNYLVSGTSGRLSLPFDTNLSTQSDVDLEITGNAYQESTGNTCIYSCQMGSQVRFRDPGVGLIRAFGGDNMKQFDRVEATLDLPNIGRWAASGENLD